MLNCLIFPSSDLQIVLQYNSEKGKVEMNEVRAVRATTVKTE